MTPSFNTEDIKKLKAFIEFATINPTILNMPQLEFVKKFIMDFGGTVPAGEFKMPTSGTDKCPFGGDSKPSSAGVADDISFESESESEPESELDLVVEGIIESDEIVDQPMGVPGKIPTDAEIEEAGKLRSLAAAAYGEQTYDLAIKYYTEAIELNPGNALFYAKRGQAYLKLKKPNACIRDCDKALEINCDSAAAFKFRGRAHRLLGNWELAAVDLRQACKLDFDEEADEWLREVTPNAKKIEQRRIKKERRSAERKVKKDEHTARKSEKAHDANSGVFGGAGFGTGAAGFGTGSSGFGTAGFGPNIEKAKGIFKDPEVAAALQDIITNPANVSKYVSNPKICAMLKDFLPSAFSTGGYSGNTGATAKNQSTSEPASKMGNDPQPDFGNDDALD